MADLSDGAVGAILVLDIETAPDPHALALAGRRGGAGEASAALHAITNVTMLSARERDDGSWSEFAFSSCSAAQDGEQELLRIVDRHLAKLWDERGVALTWNGTAHDLAVLRRRAARHLMFGMPGILPPASVRMVDLMLVARPTSDARWAKLREAAAGLGIPGAWHSTDRGTGAATAGIRKSETDVAMTFILFLYELAMKRRTATPVIEGWRALGQHIARMGPHGDNLAQFRRHPLGGGLEAK